VVDLDLRVKPRDPEASVRAICNARAAIGMGRISRFEGLCFLNHTGIAVLELTRGRREWEE
jgi:hypothetical protein